jgi:putative FmdB family regulatory protein
MGASIMIYDYKCWYCETTTESIEKVDVTEIKCPRCGHFAVRQMSAPNFRVKGFNAHNGYNLPRYEDVVDEHGYAK